MNKLNIDITGVIGWDTNEYSIKRELKNAGEIDQIDVFVNSPGGFIDDGFGIYAALKNHDAKVNMHIVGAAYSMASVIAMSGDTVTIEDTGMMMIHAPASVVGGQAKDMRKEADVLDKYESRLINAYQRRDLNLTTKQLNKAVKNETWYTAAEALQSGFVDKITDDYSDTKGPTDSAVKWMRMAGFKNMPESIAAMYDMNMINTMPTMGVNFPGGSAVDLTSKANMTDELKKSKAEHEAEINAAVEANDKKWQALLAHENASNTKAVLEIASMNLDAEKSSKLMGLVSAPVENSEPEDTAENDYLERTKKLEESFIAFMEKSDLEHVNRNAGTDDPEIKNKEPETAEQIMKRLAQREVA